MKFLSLFKFKGNKNNINSLLRKTLNNVKVEIFSELKKDIYGWKKSDVIKEYECFIFSKFLINYSFPIVYKDLDKNANNAFNKIMEEVFSELHEEEYSSVLDYKEKKKDLDQKYDLFYSLRKEHNPPLCWHLIYCSLTGKNAPEEIQAELLGLKKAVKSLKGKVDTGDLITKFEKGINYRSKVIESFDLAEISFRQAIRLIKKQLSSIDISKQLSSKK